VLKVDDSEVSLDAVLVAKTIEDLVSNADVDEMSDDLELLRSIGLANVDDLNPCSLSLLAASSISDLLADARLSLASRVDDDVVEAVGNRDEEVSCLFTRLVDGARSEESVVDSGGLFEGGVLRLLQERPLLPSERLLSPSPTILDLFCKSKAVS
jgi:hypothetical protein